MFEKNESGLEASPADGEVLSKARPTNLVSVKLDEKLAIVSGMAGILRGGNNEQVLHASTMSTVGQENCHEAVRRGAEFAGAVTLGGVLDHDDQNAIQRHAIESANTAKKPAGRGEPSRKDAKGRTSKSQQEDGLSIYLDQIGQYSLLTKEDEVVLGRRIQNGLAAQRQLDQNQSLSESEKRTLLIQVSRGKRAQQDMTNANLRLVVSIAKKFGNSHGVPLLDMIQEGNMGLMHAVRKFEGDRGFKFSTYASWWIRQAISRGIDNTSRIVRLPIHERELHNKIHAIFADMSAEMDRPPTFNELFVKMREMHPNLQLMRVVQALQGNDVSRSLDATVTNDTTTTYGDLVRDEDVSLQPDQHLIEESRMRTMRGMFDLLEDCDKEILLGAIGADTGDKKTLAVMAAENDMDTAEIKKRKRRALEILKHPLNQFLLNILDDEREGYSAEQWRHEASCGGDEPSLFFSNLPADLKEAKEKCLHDCPVKDDCFAYAENQGPAFGIWGGKTAKEIAGAIRKSRRQLAKSGKNVSS